MKKVNLKNIIIISFLILSLVAINFDYSICCETDECCETECCEENTASVDSDLNLSSTNTKCCEYKESFGNKIQAAASLNTNISISTPSILYYHIPNKYDCKNCLQESSVNYIREGHSISILRI